MSAPEPAEKPTEFVFESLDDKTQFVVVEGKDYEKPMGYLVTLRYDPDNRQYRDKRVDEKISVDGENYTIVTTTENSVTVEAPNRKRPTITVGGAAETSSP